MINKKNMVFILCLSCSVIYTALYTAEKQVTIHNLSKKDVTLSLHSGVFVTGIYVPVGESSHNFPLNSDFGSASIFIKNENFGNIPISGGFVPKRDAELWIWQNEKNQQWGISTKGHPK